MGSEILTDIIKLNQLGSVSLFSQDTKASHTSGNSNFACQGDEHPSLPLQEQSAFQSLDCGGAENGASMRHV